MNENLNLVEILKDCPKGTKLYCTVYGEVELYRVDYELEYPISVKNKKQGIAWLSSDGRLNRKLDGECVLFPSKDQRDWSKFKPKKDRFDPKTLMAFDKVLFRDSIDREWTCGIFSHANFEFFHPFKVGSCSYRWCIPYNEDTKHIVGSQEEAPEYYRYWED